MRGLWVLSLGACAGSVDPGVGETAVDREPVDTDVADSDVADSDVADTDPVDTDLVLEPDIPRFSEVLPIDVDPLEELSLFRSSVGHDYSDDHESCRSMKHYLCAQGCETGRHNPSWTTLVVRSPVAGRVVRVDVEQSGFGAQVAIQPDGYETWEVRLFHLTTDVAVGDVVAAGDALGHHASDDTLSDVAVLEYEPTGFRLVSFFDTLTDAGFADLSARGVATRAALQITQAERDAAPLSCAGEVFVGGDGLEAWRVLR